MQISSSREYYGCEPTPDLAVLDARTTNAVPALYVPEKLKRRECEMSNRRDITARLASISGDATKKPLLREGERSGRISGKTWDETDGAILLHCTRIAIASPHGAHPPRPSRGLTA
jgi:hypothetical protein